MSTNTNLHSAKKAKNDEFYTQYEDIAKELPYYKEQLADKIIYCNCDNPKYSNFYKFFKDKFEEYKLKSVIATYFNANEYTYKTTFDGNNERIEPLNSYGDFRSATCRDILSNTDVVITNPPFSLFREFVELMFEFNKKFLIIGNINAITYKEIFAKIKLDEAWLGNGMGRWISGFIVPLEYELYGTETKINENGQRIIATNNCLWLTNIDIVKRHKDLILTKRYEPEKYPKYDNYNAINVDKTNNIPYDYDGVMGVPITFLDKYNPKQFEIIGIDRYVIDNPRYGHRFTINGKETYCRILIKRK